MSRSLNLQKVLGCVFWLMFVFLQETYGYDRSTRCYGELGCFPNGSPWTSKLRPFPPPQSPQEINTTLICYTRESQEGKAITLWPSVSLDDCPFSPERPTIILIHGWCILSTVEFCTAWMRNMKSAFLDKVDANVFLVEWLEGAESPYYLPVASNIRVVAAELARFIKHLQKVYDFDPGKVHMIGNSLGPHVAGLTGKLVPGLGRITALDAAQPLFEDVDPRVRLAKSDAMFVDLIHTSSSPMVRMGGFGLKNAYGHVDFYINGGYKQPECGAMPETFVPVSQMVNFFTNKNHSDVLKFAIEKGCSHNRAIELFMEAITRDNCSFWGRPTTTPQPVFRTNWMGKTTIEELVSNVKECNPSLCTPVGLTTPNYPARGSFLVNTTEISQFCNQETHI